MKVLGVTPTSFEYYVPEDFPNHEMTHYVAVDGLGEGAYAIVLEVNSSVDGENYALKYNRSDEMAKREIRMIHYMNQKEKEEGKEWIIQLIASFVFEDGSSPFLMPIYREDISCLSGWTPLNKIIDIAKQLFEALIFLKQYNVIHRDIKPENIFMDKDTLRLGDFGLAVFNEEAGQCGLQGSRHYLSPELLPSEGPHFGFASDLWAAGCVVALMVGKNNLFNIFNKKDFRNELNYQHKVCFEQEPDPSVKSTFESANPDKKVKTFNSFMEVAFANQSKKGKKELQSLLKDIFEFDHKTRISVQTVSKRLREEVEPAFASK